MRFLSICSLLLLFVLPGCSETDRSGGLFVVLNVTTTDPQPALTELRPSLLLDGKKSVPLNIEPFKPLAMQRRFALELPPGTRGRLVVTLEGKPDYAYVTHRGSATQELEEDRVYELPVMLNRQEECSDTGWCWEGSLPRGSSYRDVWGTGPNDVWVVGDGGSILHYDGWAFSRVPVLDDNPAEALINPLFKAIHGTGPEDVWAISGIRGGQSQRYSLCKYDPQKKGFRIVYRVARDGVGDRDDFGALWVTKEWIWVGGNRWDRGTERMMSSDVPRLPPNMSGVAQRAIFHRLFAPDPAKPNELWAVGSIYTTVNKPAIWRWDGTSWQEEQVDPTPDDHWLYHIWGLPGGDLFASTNDGLLSLRREGTAWKRLPQWGGRASLIYGVDRAGNLLAISGKPDEAGNLAGTRLPKMLYVRANASTDLVKLTSGFSVIRAFPLPNQADPIFFIVGEGGTVQRYDVAQNRLDVLIPGAMQRPEDLNDVFGFAADDVWAVGNAGIILHYDGTRWTEQTPRPVPAATNLRAIWGASPTDVWAVGDGGTVLHRTGADGPFTAVTSGVPARLNAVWGTDASEVFAVGDDSTLLRWNGSEWTKLNPGTSGSYQAVWATPSPTKDVWVGGCGASCFLLKRDGSSWLPVSLPMNVKVQFNKLRGAAPNNLALACNVNNSNQVYYHDGMNWQSYDAQGHYGLMMFGPSSVTSVGYADSMYSLANPKLTSIGGSTFLYGLWGPAADNLWAVGQSGTILHYRPKK